VLRLQQRCRQLLAFHHVRAVARVSAVFYAIKINGLAHRQILRSGTFPAPSACQPATASDAAASRLANGGKEIA